MLKLLHVSFLIEIEGRRGETVQEGGNPKFRKECKDLFTDMGFHVKEACKVREAFRNLHTSLGLETDDDLVQRGDECLRIMEQSIDGNLFSSSLSEIEEKLQSGKTFHYKALKSYGTVYIPSAIEARDYYNKHLDAYEKTVIQFLEISHERLNAAWISNPVPYYKGDIRICLGHDVIYFFSFKIDEVLKDMVNKGLIISDGAQVAPRFALPESYQENKRGYPYRKGR